MTLKIFDVQAGNEIKSRTKVIQKKTGMSVQFEITKQTREALVAWINFKKLKHLRLAFSKS